MATCRLRWPPELSGAWATIFPIRFRSIPGVSSSQPAYFLAAFKKLVMFTVHPLEGPLLFGAITGVPLVKKIVEGGSSLSPFWLSTPSLMAMK